jgi:hypothetical protein
MTDAMKALLARWRTAEFNYDFSPSDCANELEAAITALRSGGTEGQTFYNAKGEVECVIGPTFDFSGNGNHRYPHTLAAPGEAVAFICGSCGAAHKELPIQAIVAGGVDR